MSFQQKVDMRLKSGYPGGHASTNVYYEGAVLAGVGGVVPGYFASITGDGNLYAEAAMHPAVATNGGAKALGIVDRSRIGTFDFTRTTDQNLINEGMACEIKIAGDARIALLNYADATNGMKVFYASAAIVGTGSADAPQFPAGSCQALAAGTVQEGWVESDWFVYSLDDYDGDNMAKCSTVRKN